MIEDIEVEYHNKYNSRSDEEICDFINGMGGIKFMVGLFVG